MALNLFREKLATVRITTALKLHSPDILISKIKHEFKKFEVPVIPVFETFQTALYRNRIQLESVDKQYFVPLQIEYLSTYFSVTAV